MMSHVFSKTTIANRSCSSWLHSTVTVYVLWLYHVSAGGNLGNEFKCDLCLFNVNILTGDWTQSIVASCIQCIGD